MPGVGAFLAVLLVATSGCSRVPSIVRIDASVEAAPDRPQALLPARQFTERDHREPPRFQPCLLGSDCLALDSRPFQLCLVAAERCPQDAEIYRVPVGVPPDQQ